MIHGQTRWWRESKHQQESLWIECGYINDLFSHVSLNGASKQRQHIGGFYKSQDNLCGAPFEYSHKVSERVTPSTLGQHRKPVKLQLIKFLRLLYTLWGGAQHCMHLVTMHKISRKPTTKASQSKGIGIFLWSSKLNVHEPGCLHTEPCSLTSLRLHLWIKR